MNPYNVFLSNFLKNPKQVAAISESSQQVIKKIVSHIDFSNAKNIIEYGPGTGVVTKAMLDNMGKDSKLFCFEPNADFCSFLREDINDPRLIILADSAENLNLSRLGVNEANYVLSGIPFSLIPKSAKLSILGKTRDALAENGKFIVYQQYNWHMAKYLKKEFGKVSTQIELRNLPPTFIFVCEKNGNRN